MNRAIVTVIAIGAVALLAAIGALAPLAANAGPTNSNAALLGPDAPVQHTPYNPQIDSVPAPTSVSYRGAALVDYDSNDNGLIEVSSLAQLDAIRWDLDGNGAVDTGTATADAVKYTAAFPNSAAGMGCQLVDHDDATIPPAPVCTGYELTQNLDFDTDDDGSTYIVPATGTAIAIGDSGDAYYNGGQGWLPIGTEAAPFSATFDGKGNTIANLFINRTATTADLIALFGHISASGAVRNLGLTDVNITGFKTVGSLAGVNEGTVSNCYATGSVTGHGNSTTSFGGLVGRVTGGTITSSYAAVAVSGRDSAGPGRDRIGGLVGRMKDSTAAITASYATGAVSSGHNNVRVGGLVGMIFDGPAIVSSYATGSVSGSRGQIGGLVGGGNGGSVTASYATGTVTGGSNSAVGGLYGFSANVTIADSYAIGAVGSGGIDFHGLIGITGPGSTNTYWDTGTTGKPNFTGGTGKTTRDLQSPTTNTGIYATWQAAQWDFGTARQYPAVKHNGKVVGGQRQTSIQSDNWNAPVVGEPVTAGQSVTDDANVTWQWQSSADGATWTNIANATTATYIPVAADAASGGKFLRAQATFTVSGDTQTLTTVNTAKVIAATTAPDGGAASITPIVGEKLRSYHPSVIAVPPPDSDPTVPPDSVADTWPAIRTDWSWLRCDDAAMTTNCKLAHSTPVTQAHTEYTPVAGTDTDVGKYLQAYAYYANSGNSNAWTRTQTAVLGPVVAAAPAPTTTP